jgi:hypothetical protein
VLPAGTTSVGRVSFHAGEHRSPEVAGPVVELGAGKNAVTWQSPETVETPIDVIL